jgi:transcriptional antiterminator RfaH
VTKGGSLSGSFQTRNTTEAKRRTLITMLLTASEISSDQPVGSWFCLRSQPKREHIAAACLRQIAEVEVFCPRVRFRKSTKRGPVWFIEAMFPGYLFARFDYRTVHRQIRQTPGVSGFVQFGERFAVLPDALIGEMRTHTGMADTLEISCALEPGQEVEITQGPFQGLRALITRIITARERVEILIEWMGRTLHAEAGIRDVEPATGPSLAKTGAAFA